MHHMALIICEHLAFKNKNKLISRIYEHWACCKIEKDIEEEELCNTIRNKLNNVKGISFIDIA